MFARKIQVELIKPLDPSGSPGASESAVKCPIAWLDGYSMRSFTGRSAFDDTLPLDDGLLEAGLGVDLGALRADLEDWLTRKFGAGHPVRLRLTEVKTNE